MGTNDDSGRFPWFPFMAQDFLTSRKVRAMTPEAVGVYVLLLCNQWEGGALPHDESELSRMANGAPPNVVRTVLERCFNDVGTGFENARLENIRNEQIERRNKHVLAGRASGKSRRGNNNERRSNVVRTSFEHVSNNIDKKKSRGEKKKTTETNTSADADRLFEEVWAIHRKGPKADAYKQYRKAVPSRISHEDLVGYVTRYVTTFKGDFTGAHLHRWIRDSRWEEYNGAGPPKNARKTLPMPEVQS